MHFFGAQCLDLTSTVSREVLCRRPSPGSSPPTCRVQGAWAGVAFWGVQPRPRGDRRQRPPQARGPVLAPVGQCQAHSASPEGTLEGLGLFSDQAELFEVCGTVSVWAGLGPLLFYWGISIPQNPAEWRGSSARGHVHPRHTEAAGLGGSRCARLVPPGSRFLPACLQTQDPRQLGKQTVWKRGTQ